MTTKDEPVEWLTGCPECGMDGGCDCDSGTWNPPANANAGKPWVGLTPEERQACTQSPFTYENYLAIEAKLKEKNDF